jgi:hypothetical protein
MIYVLISNQLIEIKFLSEGLPTEWLTEGFPTGLILVDWGMESSFYCNWSDWLTRRQKIHMLFSHGAKDCQPQSTRTLEYVLVYTEVYTIWNPNKVLTRYIPCIYLVYSDRWYILIYLVYTKYKQLIRKIHFHLFICDVNKCHGWGQ